MDWQTLRNQFMRDIGGDPPGAFLEDELILAYADHPEAVERSVEKITLAFKAGKIHSPWGALKTEVAKAVDAARNPTHDKGATRQKVIQRAESWIRTSGIHYDRETEIVDEVFGDRGILRDHHTPELEQRIVSLWTELRPLGEIVEQDAIDFGLRYQQQQAELRKALKLSKQLVDAGAIGNLEPPAQSEPSPAVQALLDDNDGIPF